MELPSRRRPNSNMLGTEGRSRIISFKSMTNEQQNALSFLAWNLAPGCIVALAASDSDCDSPGYRLAGQTCSRTSLERRGMTGHFMQSLCKQCQLGGVPLASG